MERCNFNYIFLFFPLFIFFALFGCSSSYPIKTSEDFPTNVFHPTSTHYQTGYASWYGPGFHGRKTASGERFNKLDLTCAHRTLPFGTKLRVVNLQNGKSTMVRVNDRGPVRRSRIIDLSYAAAQEIGMMKSGVVKVAIERLAQEKTFSDFGREEMEDSNSIEQIIQNTQK